MHSLVLSIVITANKTKHIRPGSQVNCIKRTDMDRGLIRLEPCQAFLTAAGDIIGSMLPFFIMGLVESEFRQSILGFSTCPLLDRCAGVGPLF